MHYVINVRITHWPLVAVFGICTAYVLWIVKDARKLLRDASEWSIKLVKLTNSRCKHNDDCRCRKIHMLQISNLAVHLNFPYDCDDVRFATNGTEIVNVEIKKFEAITDISLGQITIHKERIDANHYRIAAHTLAEKVMIDMRGFDKNGYEKIWISLIETILESKRIPQPEHLVSNGD